MSRPLRLHDRVLITDGAYAGVYGWIWRIEVEPTTEFKAVVVLTIQLSKPYGEMTEVMPCMVILDENKHTPLVQQIAA